MASFCAKKLVTIFSCSVLAVLLLSFTYSTAQTVPALYVFGDSLVDVGNNNYLPLSTVKANFPYNGIDYPGKKGTGRFSNGKNAADFLAERLGLSSAPPYLSQPNNVFPKGVSFASGGAGIFNDTDAGIIKQTIPFALQVRHFSTVRQRLVKEMGSAAAEEHLSKSIFPIVIGSNDIIGYFNPGSDVSKKTTPQQHVIQMVSAFKETLKVLHGLGAQKFLFIGLPPIGCAPKQRFNNETNECNKEVNYWSNKYNEVLTQMVQELKLELNKFQYSYFDTYNVFVNFIENPLTYGFKEIKGACCGLGKLRAELPCTPIALYCSNRNEHLFWDIYHPTETAAHIFIDILFRGSRDYVFPITLPQLIAI